MPDSSSDALLYTSQLFIRSDSYVKRLSRTATGPYCRTRADRMCKEPCRILHPTHPIHVRLAHPFRTKCEANVKIEAYRWGIPRQGNPHSVLRGEEVHVPGIRKPILHGLRRLTNGVNKLLCVRGYVNGIPFAVQRVVNENIHRFAGNK